MNEEEARFLDLKRQSAVAASALVGPGMVVGLGTGSTAALVVEELGRRMREEGLRFVGIPTSEATETLARQQRIELAGFATHQHIDLTIDGADEVERGSLFLIKGLGGALLREKIVAAASERMVIVADDRKVVDHLGDHTPVPVEVVPFGWENTARRLEKLGAEVEARRTRDGQLFVTDGGNLILDCRFGQIADPAGLEHHIGDIVGVIESGLFIGYAAEAIIAGKDGVFRLHRER
ncbi:ribose 5-phosphate isomerase A [Acetobacter sp. AN02]|uniref:ribose 5-phosphate isomerase A n=1 Tax=Acetobacter sp. AN02 TaxID=2894186 RepID=UPI00243442CB|nr:ribose 5-phosphate isomerase A [Acetobacter sp. AN02]MDG6093621.1 ribose 5-phosphate isomerase A [Acetobacter sp. AN02]